MKRSRILAIAAAVALMSGAMVSNANSIFCDRCYVAYDTCLARGTDPDICYGRLEVCLVRNGCWVN